MPETPNLPEVQLSEFDSLIDAMIAERMRVCHEYSLDVNHRHTIGCVLVLQHMKENHPHLNYGTQAQWDEEAAFCARHEREILKRFLVERMGIEKATRFLKVLQEINE